MTSAGTLRYVQTKSDEVKKQSRDDVGRWRKIYYRLRQSQGADWKVQRAGETIESAEQELERTGEAATPEHIEKRRREIASLRLSEDVDERTRSEIVQSAQEAAGLMHRLEVRGPDTLVSFGQLPAEVQDALKRYLGQNDLEPRITKHFVPFMNGEINRSVKDILNLVERVVIDNQEYRRGYDVENV